MEISNIILGMIMLLFGRKLYWLFIGIAGFLFGMEISRMFFGGQSQWLQLAIAIGLGCLGALLALLVQRLAFTIGGFLAGVFLAIKASPFIAVPDHGAMLLLIIGAGIFGAVVATLVMDMAITILVCLVGAAAIVGELQLGPVLNFLAFVILVGAGFLFQEKILPRRKEDRRTW